MSMTYYIRRMQWLCCCILLGLLATQAQAQTLRMVTGPDTGTYAAFGKDIATEVKAHGITLQLQSSNGSIDNIKRIVNSKGRIPLGIVQSDVLGFLKRSSNPNTQSIAQRLSLMFPLYEEEVHILARKSIRGLRDLQGKRVVVGKQGSGNMLTAINILSLAQISAGELIYMPPEEGVVAVLANQADAMVFVGGKPVPLFTNLSTLADSDKPEKVAMLKQVHLVPIDDQRVFTEYSPSRINAGDYGFVNQTVLTAKVQAVMVAFQEAGAAQQNSYSSADCQPIYRVAEALYRQLDTLRASGHPKWRETNLFDNVAQWQRNQCIWDGGRLIVASSRATPASGGGASPPPSALTNDLLDVLRNGAAGQ